jgi:vancomycin permeability regulator SanA
MSTTNNDGWSLKPSGWNHFDLEEYGDDIINVSLEQYEQEYVFVLAGGLDNLGRNHPWVKDRLDVAYRLYEIKKRKIIILGGGTYHKPPHINREKFVIHESTMGAKYLLDKGIPAEDLYREWGSYDTIANGFFSLLNFIIPLGIKSALVITSDFHMPRSKAIFRWIYQLWNQKCDLEFLEVSTKYLDNEIIQARTDREKRSLITFHQVMDKIQTMKDFHYWFYREHQAYNCNFNGVKEEIDHVTSKSY